ncbi:MAG: M3 family oligoendopeptidase, partial [Eubacterium sp.]|nr:M3 family oligoendopeptidase [Eubacterium sp.]
MIKFSDILYERPDLEQIKMKMDEITRSFICAESYREAAGFFVAMDRQKRHVESMEMLAAIRHSIDTRDSFYDDEVSFWNHAGPELMEYLERWNKALCESSFRDLLAEEFGEIVFKNIELELKCFDPVIVPLLQEENKLTTEYEKLLASAQIPFRGKTYTIAQMNLYKNDPNDQVRLEAWKAEGSWYIENQEKLDGLYDRLVALRHEMSRKLGLKDYVEMAYFRMKRNCYDRQDVERFREAVRSYLVPVADKIRRRQAQRMGMNYPLSFADCALMFRSGNAAPVGGADDILAAAGRFYDALSPETSEFFRTMMDGELMDVLSREGKEGGGYCTSIYDYDVPFIFANFNGTRDDVETMTHEAGHAFADWTNRFRVPMETIW